MYEGSIRNCGMELTTYWTRSNSMVLGKKVLFKFLGLQWWRRDWHNKQAFWKCGKIQRKNSKRRLLHRIKPVSRLIFFSFSDFFRHLHSLTNLDNDAHAWDEAIKFLPIKFTLYHWPGTNIHNTQDIWVRRLPWWMKDIHSHTRLQRRLERQIQLFPYRRKYLKGLSMIGRAISSKIHKITSRS